MLNCQDDVVKWSVMNLWRRETSPELHLVCTLADREPLRDDSISVPEMRTILTLSGDRALNESH